MAGSQQSMGKPADMICLCIGGRLFVTRRATLYRLPESRLYLIATQGSSCQTIPGTGTPSPNPLNMSNPLSGFQSSNISERTVVAGATILPANVASLVTGNMNLKSASSLCRNRMSIVPGVSPQPPPLLPMTDSNTSMNLSVPVTPQPSGQMPPGFYPIQQAPPVVYFYDRDPEIFRFVLDYYRTGELHLPSSICGPFVRKELIFWGIDESLIGPCCMPAYMRYDEEKRTKNTLFRDCFEDIDSMQNLVKFSRGWKKWRYRMWLFMDHPSSSLPAK
ncbi:potassium voltage-gated channel subfamily C member 2, partial [Clonorchis sinensis]